MDTRTSSPVVAKVGGSLYDLPDLGSRLQAFHLFVNRPLLLVPGGGGWTDVVRDLDARHQLGEEAAHWLALRALTPAAWFLAELLPGSVVVDEPLAELSILDPYSFAQRDDKRPGALPHSWNVTSDSLAARFAEVLQASDLYLLKSVTISGSDWKEAAQRGWVDAFFPTMAARLAGCCLITPVNLREVVPGLLPVGAPAAEPHAGK